MLWRPSSAAPQQHLSDVCRHGPRRQAQETRSGAEAVSSSFFFFAFVVIMSKQTGAALTAMLTCHFAGSSLSSSRTINISVSGVHGASHGTRHTTGPLGSPSRRSFSLGGGSKVLEKSVNQTQGPAARVTVVARGWAASSTFINLIYFGFKNVKTISHSSSVNKKTDT